MASTASTPLDLGTQQASCPTTGETSVAECCPVEVPRPLDPATSFEDAEAGETIASVRKLRAPVRLPDHRTPSGRFIPKAKWEGVVVEVRTNEFDARLTDILGTADDITVTLSTDDVSPGDTQLVSPGAVFYWLIGYVESRLGQRSRVAELKFRRLPARRKQDLARAKAEATAIRRELGLE
jgi:hypothetical protein